jgi:hypothetical protein
MMAVRAAYTRLLVDEFDFSGESNGLDVSISAKAEDCTVFQETAQTYLTTGIEAMIKQKGYFLNSAAGTFEKEIAEGILASDAVTVAALFGTDTAACPAYVLRSATTNEFELASKADSVLTLGGGWIPGNGVFRGLRMFTGTISATGTQTYIDLGAAGSAGGYAWLFVQSISGTATSATITVQSDDNTGFATPATEGTFTFSAVGTQEMELSATVDRYVRLNCTSKGGATSFVVVAVIAVYGVTY